VERDVRVSDAERQAVVPRLEQAVQDGRLTVTEFDERVQVVFAARTRGDLDVVTEGLPPDLW
jgi:hypothetical protein